VRPSSLTALKPIGAAPTPDRLVWPPGTLGGVDDWRSYDSVAETYERVAAPLTLQPARDLLDLATLTDGDHLLDVGTGTGVVAGAALERGARAIGVDPSLGMLQVARKVRPEVPVVGGDTLDLPFRTGTFDVVVGSFVLAHFQKADTALFDVIRVARPGGRLVFATWADGRDAFTQTWLELVDTVVPSAMLEPTLETTYPNRDRFRYRTALEETLIDAGLKHVRTERATYEQRYAREDYIESLAIGATGRFVRQMLGENGWSSLMDRVRDVFAERFPDPLHDTRDVILSLGVKE
jgi:ubiquinone/menaquinone biosynthesis C-methylase UbiE